MSHDSQHGGHDHPKFLHHHFETVEQQFESDKFGMWLFLTTEILLFSGLFCAYTVYRGNHPEVFIYAHQFLDKRMGALNTVILLISSFTMAWAVRAAQTSRRQLLVVLLLITFLCGGGFMVVKYFEYMHKFHTGLRWGTGYGVPLGHEGDHAAAPGGHADEHAPAAGGAPAAEHDAEAAVADPEATFANDPVHAGETAPAAGEAARAAAADETPTHAEEVAAAQDELGHLPEHTADAAIGGGEPNPTPLGEEHAAPATEDAVDAAEAAAEPAAPPAAAAQVQTTAGTPPPAQAEPSKIPHAAAPPPGLAQEVKAQGVDHGVQPRNVQSFFAVYFVMTGLHGLHVLIGMLVILGVAYLGAKGTYNADYFTPVELTGLYWHLVDLIWIYLFPLLYLIA